VSSLGHWICLKQQGKLEVHSAGGTPANRAVRELESAVSRLRWELEAKLDPEILTKAAAY
jgi:hypothetical protein